MYRLVRGLGARGGTDPGRMGGTEGRSQGSVPGLAMFRAGKYMGPGLWGQVALEVSPGSGKAGAVDLQADLVISRLEGLTSVSSGYCEI